ncbi:ABC transporter substrate-binding protein [Methanospirillum lacunae]|uniref:ABC transporter substrate-binding protein n=1 Tax=Methanospirillum lacunae TaxID=668570 RepID=A0A2V2MQH1_9EURY|nr:ABC transporter substrate-binding protein [Methanospirillum lacunae]PWR69649.1 ABC transporter substrate-binding protein [Methanospirillum lacunae]
MIYLCIDDTDSLDSIGTGRLAREIADVLNIKYPVVCITRHQLFVHPDIPYTSHNSCAVIHLLDIPKTEYPILFNQAKLIMKERFVEGSDPGIALAGEDQVNSAMVAFGFDTKCMIVTQERARKIADHAGILLEGLGGSEGGVIGAIAGIGLAASGSDGRYLQLGSIREKRGERTVQEILQTGIDQVITLEGKSVSDGTVMIEKFPQPARLLGKAIVLVDERDGQLHLVKRD